MSAATTYPHLLIDANGTVRIGDTRYKVQHLAAEHYFYGWTAEELMRQHPDLQPVEVYAALTYFYDNYDELVTNFDTDASQVERLRPAPVISREELLKRFAIGEK
ncbi:DUF433 domain-containing protein [Planctomicrobium piriforme]|uniref:DUF433 domain-containing protein n=1 Tax=Planctomicrobium piriforme TaxID=1576369 RepID=A0A1I3IGY9_9PLAN|nr:DUF433 domain-containing protein [Planctomicrobium piriforme]SFI47160.1 Protein of unknown function [Planctomicrobium piriforme]